MANRNHTSPSGIYIITNSKNGKVYVGKTKNLKTRWQEHKLALNNGYHKNPHLQSAWDKYGAKAFRFLVLEYCTAEKLDEREKHHIAIYKSRGLAYNITNGGEGSSGLVFSDEHRRKMSEAKKGDKNYNFGKPLTKETRQKMSDVKLGKKRPPFSEGHRQKISEAIRHHWDSRKSIAEPKAI